MKTVAVTVVVAGIFVGPAVAEAANPRLTMATAERKVLREAKNFGTDPAGEALLHDVKAHCRRISRLVADCRVETIIRVEGTLLHCRSFWLVTLNRRTGRIYADLLEVEECREQ